MSATTNSQTAYLGAGADPMDEERRELDAVVAALANSHRLQRLVIYIGERYFRGETEKLHEYDIATEVFGRSRTAFDASDDAIVRVEAHRLRKRLKQYYANEASNHAIQLSIPAGGYVPVFIRRAPGGANALSDAVPPGLKIPWLYTATAASFLLIAVATYLIFHGWGEKRGAAAIPASPAPPAVTGMTFAKVPLRICAGYSGKPQIDNTGAVWEPDEYFQRGGAWARPQNVVRRTTDPMLFEHWRSGDFSYDIPLRAGVYELHLYFACQDSTPSGPEPFSVSVNGKKLLTGFDVNSDAMGTDIADERVFRDISPGPDGILHINFDSEGSTPLLNAIEILGGEPGKQLPIRIVTQSTSYTDRNGLFWHADNYYLGGYVSTKRLPVTGTSDPGLYTTERFGHFSYAIPVDTRDRYTLTLHFAELYFGPGASGAGGAGSRVFRVSCNGDTLLQDLDIYKEVGELHALTKTFYHLKPTAQGKLNLTFDPVVNNATISAIEVIDESR